MVGRTCPHCGDDQVTTREEFRRIYNWRAIVRDAGRQLWDALAGHGVDPRPAEDGRDMVKRWLAGEADGPDALCANCYQPVGRVAR
jgi:hypothetical protein